MSCVKSLFLSISMTFCINPLAIIIDKKKANKKVKFDTQITMLAFVFTRTELPAIARNTDTNLS